ncbi:uncharacterized protein STEHIDRAFT_145799 [Stereum hirsutum FP-91666 SS1]|uniref:uncharacterized protein n=1 Tax=Stereum hirsutum (strain FP-91666) TaxID=721885 RepID=UPI000440D2C7|nr:uncharacterized protein STEHIDRAFT_145799 [Stereum hirsutum FP-91666 SS1]EIM89032.1 hypothetical protein STEHIDRAFT_145799 [Stereum hirsutum FP-91666 SS1]
MAANNMNHVCTSMYTGATQSPIHGLGTARRHSHRRGCVYDCGRQNETAPRVRGRESKLRTLIRRAWVHPRHVCTSTAGATGSVAMD